MPRCLSCGRRVAGVHLPCGVAPPASPPPLAEVPPVPGFRRAELLGSGGFGVVVAAERETDGLRVALKIARPGTPGAAAQLRREGAALRAVGPPAVPEVVGDGELSDGTPWLAMELLAAPSLASQLEARGGPLGPEELAPAALAVIDALAAVHAAGWAHGDLKPENVLLEAGPARVRLLDLGLAERFGAAELPEPDAPAGTAEYMAPERCEGRRADARSDIYAAGVLLFEMIAGRPPFFGSPGEVRHGHLVQRPPRPGSLARVDPGLEEVILRCLAKAPSDRFPSAVALRAALAAPALWAPAPACAPRPATRPSLAPARSARRRVGAAFVEASADAVAVQKAAASLGGVVAHAERGRYALVFDPAAGENPVRMALWAGWRVVTQGLASRVRIDLLAVTAQPRPGGAERYLSAAFGQLDAWPAAGDPPGVVVTARAADVLPGERLWPFPGHGGLFLHEGGRGEDATVMSQGAPPLVGRDDLVAELVAEARTAGHGLRPTVVSVIGEPGLGKTHLAAVLADRFRIQAPAPEVIELRARGVAEAEEGNVLRPLLRMLLGLPSGPMPAPSDGGRALLELALPEATGEPVWAGAALALGWIDPGDPALRARAAAPGALSSLKARAIAALLRRRAASRALAVILDDAHLAEGAALDALELAALAEGGARLFVCALGRPSFSESRPAWGERAGHARALRLGPLEPAHAADLCRHLLLPAEAVPARAVEWLVARSQGVPLLLSELVRGLKRDGLVRAHAQGGAHYLATDELDRVPDMPVVEWLAARELGGLPKGLATHAQLAALLGGELAPEELSGVLAELERAGHGVHFPLDSGSATRRLLALGLLVAHRGGRAGFRLPLVRDALARAVPDALRQAIHEAAFRFYQVEGVVPESIRLRRLGLHAAAAGHVAEAGAIELRLAGELAATHAYVEAEARYSRALEHLPAEDSPQRLGALRGRGLMRSFVGRNEEAIDDLAAARALGRRLGDRHAEVACLLDEATALDWTSDFSRSQARAEEAANLADASNVDLHARLELARGRSLFRFARWEEAAAALITCAALAERQGDDSYETLVAALLLLGTALPAMGRAAEGEAALERAQALAAACGDLAHLSAVYINRRNLLVARQDMAGALRDQLASVQIGRELGMARTEYMGEYNLAELHYQAGEAAAVEPHLRRGAEIEQRHPEVAPLPLSALLWARLLIFTGDLAAARRRHAEFLDGLARAGAHGIGLGPAEAVLADMVELATRDGSDADWDALLARSARYSVEQEPIEVMEMRGLAALRAGRVAQAREALRSALDLAGRVPNLLAPRVRRELELAGG